MEDYLEAIYILDQKNDTVRVKDISAFMDVKKPSVNNALKVLSEKNLVNHEKYGHVVLTPEGRKASKDIKKKHDLLVRFLQDILGLKSETAVKDACRIEHVISSATNERLKKFIEFVDTCPTGQRPEWLDSFSHFIKSGKCSGRCVEKRKK